MSDKPKTQYISIDKLKHVDKNPRKISEKNLEILKESLRRNPDYFWARPILVNDASGDLVVYAGNQRMRASKMLGLDKVPVIIETLTPEQENERLFRDNIELGEWDDAIISADWGHLPLKQWGAELKPKDAEKGGKLEDDELPEEVKTICQLGDVWEMGDHKLLCGDATKSEDVAKLMGEDMIDLIVTDPPYNVAYEGKTEDKLTIKNDSFDSSEAFYQFLFDAFKNYDKHTKKGGAIYIFHADSEGLNFRKAMIDAGFMMKQCCIWMKNVHVMGRQDYHWIHEPVLYGWKPGAPHKWYADRRQNTAWHFPKPARSEDHPTMKPVELILYPIRNSSAKGDIVADFFGGSGSCLIACEKIGRKCRTIEFDPHYCDVILQRWEGFTGKKAKKL